MDYYGLSYDLMIAFCTFLGITHSHIQILPNLPVIMARKVRFKETGMNRHIFESITRALGLKFVFLPSNDHDLINNPSKRDPNVVYLFDGGKPLRRKHEDIEKPPFDALLYWHQTTIEITWSTMNKAAIRELLLRDRDLRCASCNGDTSSATDCPLCSHTTCVICLMKMALTKANREQISRGDYVLRLKCLHCRELCQMDAVQNIFMALDQLAEFPPEQRNTLLALKAANPYWDEQYADYKQASDVFDAIRLKRFREGCTIEIVGLKGKKEWNGKMAQIIGKRMIQNGTIRWPVQLSDDSEEKALLKQCNMKFVSWKEQPNDGDDHCEQQSSSRISGSSAKKQKMAEDNDENQEPESDSSAESPVHSDEVRCVPNETNEIQDQNQEHQTRSERPITFERMMYFLWEIGISVLAVIFYNALTHTVSPW